MHGTVDVEMQLEPVLKSHLGDEGKGADTLLWVQEEIFGHRFVEEQLPYMFVLEVLAICRALQIGDDGRPYQDNRLLSHRGQTHDDHESITIPIVRSIALRFILFRDRSLEVIRHSPAIAPDDRFDEWIKELDRGFANEIRQVTMRFGYLKAAFSGKFEDAYQAVRIIKGLELDALNKRRYTSRFLAPRGPSLVLNDVDLKFSTDRAFFARGGEMIYLMLNRSRLGPELAHELTSRFLDPSDAAEKLITRLIPKDGSDPRSPGGAIGYLPLAFHPAYDRMAEDWLEILKLGSLPPPQKFEPLFRITALNLVRYFGERARTVAQNPVLDPIPIDMTGGRNANLRDVCKIYFHRQRQVIEDAVETFIRIKISSVPSWQAANSHADQRIASEMAVDAIVKTFDAKRWEAKAATSEAMKRPEAWLEVFINDAKKRERNAISTMISPLGRNAGFVVARRSAGTWFSASDEFLEALVLSNVHGSMTVADFLQRLYERYGIVVGPAEQRQAFPVPPCDVSAFEENLREFEKRLTGLGYVKRLSDDCAFVSNVYSPDQ